MSIISKPGYSEAVTRDWGLLCPCPVPHRHKRNIQYRYKKPYINERRRGRGGHIVQNAQLGRTINVQMAGTNKNQASKPLLNYRCHSLATTSNHFVTLRQTALHSIAKFSNWVQGSLPLFSIRHYPAIR